MTDDLFTKMLHDALKANYCCSCEYAYIQKVAGWGLCKNQKNALGPFPMMIDELNSCELWALKKSQE